MSVDATVLLVDDEPFVLDSLAETLSAEGFTPLKATGGRAAFEVLGRERVDAVVTDLSMPDGDGMGLLEDARRAGLAVPILVLTGVGTVRDAVEAMRRGAYDFLQKPVDPDLFVRLLRHALEHHALAQEVSDFRRKEQHAATRLVGDSPAMERPRETLERVAPADTPVLLVGESGSGKDAAALELHRASGRPGHLVPVHATSLPPERFESELCGHRAGAWPGAVLDRRGLLTEAEGGTIVVDRVGALPRENQELLARVLEDESYLVPGEARPRPLRARLVATTSEDLAERVGRGDLLAELYYRINVFPIEIPALRARREDIPALARHFLGRLGTAGELDEEALEALASYDWPGNVRELVNVLERASILSEGAAPGAPLLRSVLESVPGAPARRGAGPFHMRSNLDATERRLVVDALREARGVKKEASALLGIDARNLGYYLRKHKITDQELGSR